MPSKLFHSKSGIFLIIGVVAGVLLLFFSSTTNEQVQAKDTSAEEDMKRTEEYISSLEEKVRYMLESMDGISDVNIIITPEASSETVYAQNVRYDGSSLSEKEYVMTSKDGTPIKISLIFPKIKGVAVVCRGGSNPINQEKIISLLSALFDISSSSVYVCS